MRTATPNLLILTVQAGTDNISGTAIDADILVNFAVANTDVNQRLFVPSAQLVVTGKFRLGKELATIGISISFVVAIVSIPAPVSAEIATAPVTTAESSDDVEEVVEPEIAVEDSVPSPTQPARAQTRAQKAAATRAANKAKTKAESLPC